MSLDLCKNDFTPGYEVWVHHCEELPHQNVSEIQLDEELYYNRLEEMLEDVRYEILPNDSENPPRRLDSKDLPTPEVLKATIRVSKAAN